MVKFKTFLFLFSLVLLGNNDTFAQKKVKHTISGFIEDSSTGEKLLGASVFETNSQAGTTSNVYGFFSLSLEGEKAELYVSYIGYKTAKISINLDQDHKLEIKLDKSNTLKTVEIRAEKSIQDKTDMGTIEVPIKTIEKMPALFGEVDVIKALQLLPGVKSGGEGSSGMYVRGGGPDQNLILLDGVPVYNVSHLFGFFSVFNSDALSNVTLIKGGFPARYGGRLSSVLDITMKEGNNQKLAVEGSVGVIASRLTVEGPIGKDKKTSFILSGRRTYIDILSQPIIRLAIAAQSEGQASGAAGYYFQDFNGKINRKISEKDRVYLSFYTGVDKFYSSFKEKGDFNTSELKFGLGWGNFTSALRWNHVFNPKLFGNLTATYSRYQFDISANIEDISNFPGSPRDTTAVSLNYNSAIKDYAVKADFDFLPNPEHFIKFGASTIRHQFKPEAIQTKIKAGADEIDTTIRPSPEIGAYESYIYAEDDWKISNRLKVNFGVHVSHFNVRNTNYFSFQPRINARYLIDEFTSIKASYTKMQQYIHLLSNSGISLPTDLWLPATDKVKPQDAHQVAVGVARSLFDNQYELSIEGYYKKMNNLIEYKNGASFVGSTDWESKIETNGQGWSYGAEVFLQKKYGKTTGWFGYTLSWAQRQFDNLNFGQKYFYRYDRRHDFSLVLVHQINDKWGVSGTWVYGTGNAVSFPLQIYNQANSVEGAIFGNNQLQYYGERNSFRMKAYHRLDLGVNRTTFTKKKNREIVWNFGLYNAYSRRNPYFIFLSNDYVYDGNGSYTQVRKARQFSLFPVIPSVSLSFKF